jgi:hypothetical protein
MAGSTEYYFYNNGFTINSGANSFTLAATPPVGTVVVAPAINQFAIAAFDQPTVAGVSNPLQQTQPFWMMDISTINNFKYTGLPNSPGIYINAVQQINGVGAQTSWISFACSNASGNAMTFGATGAGVYTAPISAFTTLASTVSAMASAMMAFPVVSASAFYPGDYFVINIGNATQELLHIISVDSTNNILYSDTGGTSYIHYASELIFACGRKFWMQLTVPVNANNGNPESLFNLTLNKLGAIQSRM